MARRPLIALDALLVGDEPTGVGRSILELTRALAASDRGFDFTLLLTHPEPFAQLEGAAHWHLELCPGARGGPVRKALFTQIHLPRLCRRMGVDLLHSLQFVTPLRMAIPQVVTVHDLAWKSYAGLLQTSREMYYNFFVPRSLKAAAAIVTNSESTSGDVRAFAPELADLVSTTPFGTPSWVWEMETGDTGTPFVNDSQNPGPYFLFVGTLEPRKNLERLLAAFECFYHECLTGGRRVDAIPKLVLAGARGWNDSEIKRKIAHLEQVGLLTVLDYCSVSRLWQLYSGAVGLVFPSLHEGFGFPILEAMAAGCPVLTSDRGAMREVGGEVALYVIAEDQASISRGMHALAWGEGQSSERKQRGRSRAQQWDWETTASTTCAVYQDVLRQI